MSRLTEQRRQHRRERRGEEELRGQHVGVGVEVEAGGGAREEEEGAPERPVIYTCMCYKMWVLVVKGCVGVVVLIFSIRGHQKDLSFWGVGVGKVGVWVDGWMGWWYMYTCIDV